MAYFEEDGSLESEREKRVKLKSKDFLKAIEEAKSDKKMSKILSGLPNPTNSTTIMSLEDELRLIKESTKKSAEKNTTPNRVNEVASSETPNLESSGRRTSIRVPPLQLDQLSVKKSISSAFKSPKKQLTELEKQRRELNKLKGKNLDECLNKHREVVRRFLTPLYIVFFK